MKRADFTIEPATPADDPALRRLLRQNPVSGHLTLSYRREPNYFLGCDTLGHRWQVMVARHQPSGDVAGLAARSVRPCYLNGQIQPVGYISQLRVAPRFQGRWLTAAAFRALAQMHRADPEPVVGYLTTIIEGNRLAEGLLVKHRRRSMPAFQPLARLATLALILRRRRNKALPAGVRQATPADLPAIADLLQQTGRRRQFFPHYTPADFIDSPLTRNFALADFLLLERGSRLIAAAGLWDQRGFKQHVVEGYGSPLKQLRPLLNFGLRLAGAQPLPPPGGDIRFAYVAFIAVDNDDPTTFNLLLRGLYRLAAGRGFAFLMLGLTEADPLLPVARRYRHIPYYSRLYAVAPPGRDGWLISPDDRPPYLELAAL